MAEKEKETKAEPEAAPVVEPSQQLIWVAGTAEPDSGGGYRLGLFERHPDHPEGEAFVAGPQAVLVAATSKVLERLNGGRLRKATKAEIAEAKKEK